MLPAELSCGGGEGGPLERGRLPGIVGGLRPLNMLQNRLKRKMSCAALVKKAAMVMNVCSGSDAFRYSIGEVGVAPRVAGEPR